MFADAEQTVQLCKQILVKREPRRRPQRAALAASPPEGNTIIGSAQAPTNIVTPTWPRGPGQRQRRSTPKANRDDRS